MPSEKSDTWRSSSYCNELQEEDKTKCKRKLTLTNGQLLPDPYGIVENWKSVTKLMPDVSWGDMHNYKIQAFNFFVCSHIQYIYYNEITKKIWILQYQNKGKYLNIFIKKLF